MRNWAYPVRGLAHSLEWFHCIMHAEGFIVFIFVTMLLHETCVLNSWALPVLSVQDKAKAADELTAPKQDGNPGSSAVAVLLVAVTPGLADQHIMVSLCRSGRPKAKTAEHTVADKRGVADAVGRGGMRWHVLEVRTGRAGFCSVEPKLQVAQVTPC